MSTLDICATLDQQHYAMFFPRIWYSITTLQLAFIQVRTPSLLFQVDAFNLAFFGPLASKFVYVVKTEAARITEAAFSLSSISDFPPHYMSILSEQLQLQCR